MLLFDVNLDKRFVTASPKVRRRDFQEFSMIMEMESVDSRQLSSCEKASRKHADSRWPLSSTHALISYVSHICYYFLMRFVIMCSYYAAWNLSFCLKASGKEFRNVFRYHWQHYSVAQLARALNTAGFQQVYVYDAIEGEQTEVS